MPISTRTAIEAMPEGCIAVADAMGIATAGIFGDILTMRMMKRNVAALVTDGVIRTPPLESGCLPGVTREVMLEQGLIAEARLGPADLARATAVFVTSSTRGVQPIARVDDHDVPESPDGVTEHLMRAWEELIAAGFEL